MIPPPSALPRTRVLIDAYNLDLPHGTGVATYARNLSYCLRTLGFEIEVLHGRRTHAADDPLLREIGFFDAPPPPRAWARHLRRAREWFAGSVGLANHALPITLSGRVIAEEQRRRMAVHDRLYNAPEIYEQAHRQFTSWGTLHSLKLAQPPAIAHWTYPLPIRIPGARNLYTMHDLVPLRLPFTTLDRKRRYLKLMRRLAATADHIVTISECSRHDIINLLGVAPERVTNTYQSVTLPSAFVNKPADVAAGEIESTYQLKAGEYFLFVGAIEPKKNVGRMVEAYLASGVRTPLVIAGPRAWNADRELALFLANERRLRNRIRVLEYVPLSMLVNLMRGARALLFPSIYEGFGLPVLEAMLLGTPVLSSNTSSIPEIAGDAALLVDPYSVQALAEAIRGLDDNDAMRAELSARGRRQAALFSPERYAERMAALYTQVLSEAPR